MRYQYLAIGTTSDKQAEVRVLPPEILDNAVVEKFNLELLALSTELEQPSVVLNLTRVARISTGVINGLLACQKRLIAESRKLLLSNPSEQILHNLRILNLEHTVFEIIDQPEE